MPDSTAQPAAPPPPGKQMALPEFVAIAAMLMATNALAIDIMLPALPAMATHFQVATENDRQLVIISYMVGFGLSQLVYGPLTDRFGRRRVLFLSLASYVVTSAACLFAPSFEWLIFFRVLQGSSAGGSRVIAVSAARDLYAGRRMASVMSLIMIVFMMAPIVAPSLGQALLVFTDWRGIFWFLTAFGAVMFLWVLLRLPETLPVERRVPFNLPTMLGNYRKIFTYREALGYTIASGLLFGGMMSYISSSEQIYHEVYHTGTAFPLWFAGVALAMSVANLVNSRLVERFGMRRMSHAPLVVLVVLTAGHAFLASQGPIPFELFYAITSLSFFLIGFQGPNYNAIAMEPLGRLAGSGAALIGFSSTLVSAAIGGTIARGFDGTLAPIATGQTVVYALALLAIFITERGRLMRPHQVD